MKIILLVITFFCCHFNSTYAQNTVDSLNIERSRNVIHPSFKSTLDSANYLLYNIDEKFLIIVKKKKKYVLYFIKGGKGIEDSLCISSKNKILSTAFDPLNFDNSLKMSSETLTPHPHARYIFFYIKDKGIILCQFNLPSIFNGNVQGKVYPIEESVHKFLLKNIFSHWKQQRQ